MMNTFFHPIPDENCPDTAPVYVVENLWLHFISALSIMQQNVILDPLSELLLFDMFFFFFAFNITNNNSTCKVFIWFTRCL